ncbi:MAG: GTPase HflX [Candidatus Omnitrophica bacterium]|nr:GTPase HflX [Candidatus Omnitrophota bacterium]
MSKNMHQTETKEKALLVVSKAADEVWSQEALGQELKNLVVSAGVEVLEVISFNLGKINPAFYIGKGKVEEVADKVKEIEASVVIFNSDLHFAQQRNLEDVLGVKTIDRTQLILDIFARHAQTQEGILQVELAQLEYLLPRLRGQGIALSRLGGGIGTRGPGEKKLEVDKRRITDHIGYLKKDLKLIISYRATQRKKREKQGVNTCSLVGYTNAGKSTLFNALSGDNQKTSSILFTTLDTVARTLALGRNLKIVLSDTVGFIYKLPLKLIDAFKATLEELNYADVILHVIDSGNSDIEKIKNAVEETLRNLKLNEKPTVVIFNKIDTIPYYRVEQLKKKYPGSIFVSAIKAEGLENLKEEVQRLVFKDMVEATVDVPFDRMDISAYLHDKCEVLDIEYLQEKVIFKIRANVDKLAYVKKQGFRVKEV